MFKNDFSSYMGTRRASVEMSKWSFGMLWIHYHGEGFMDDFGTLVEYYAPEWRVR